MKMILNSLNFFFKIKSQDAPEDDHFKVLVKFITILFTKTLKCRTFLSFHF